MHKICYHRKREIAHKLLIFTSISFDSYYLISATSLSYLALSVITISLFDEALFDSFRFYLCISLWGEY